MTMDANFLLRNIIEAIGKQSEVEFKCGDCVGPFKVESPGEGFRVTLINFTGESMGMEIEASPVTRRIVGSPSPLLANCVVLQTGALVQILFTKDVKSNEALRAILVADMHYREEEKEKKRDKEKKYECPKCHMAKFNSLQNLKVHEELYCSRREMEVSSSDEKPQETQNLILLPLAFHDMPQQNTVQVMGPIHSVVPVAVGRKANISNTSPIYVHKKKKGNAMNGNGNGNLNLISNIDLEWPVNLNLNVSNSEMTIKIPVIDLDEKPVHLSTPLDLSSSSRAASVHVSPSCSPLSKSSSAEPVPSDRPFLCSCGVSFSSQTTFDAHKQFYCKNSQTRSSTSGANRSDACRKVPEKCAQCDFVPVSSSQLAMHIRSVHQATKTFTCNVCGYRAFSMRGIRTHMRSHPTDDSQKFRVNEPTTSRASSRP